MFFFNYFFMTNHVFSLWIKVQLLTLYGKYVTDNIHIYIYFCIIFFQRQLDSESSKVSSKKAMEKIEMLNNRRQEVNLLLFCIP